MVKTAKILGAMNLRSLINLKHTNNEGKFHAKIIIFCNDFLNHLRYSKANLSGGKMYFIQYYGIYQIFDKVEV